MQSFSSRPGSSEVQRKSSPSAPNSRRSLSPCLRKSSIVWSNSTESKPSKVSERKPSPKPQSFQEKQKPVRVPDMQEQWGQLQEDLRRTKEERSSALQELEELKKKKNEESLHSQDRINMLEQEAEKAKESEGKMLESLFSQTKQLEQTKILLEEAKLEIRNLPCLSCPNPENDGSLDSIQATDEIRKLRNELRLALQAEEKSKKAMDDLAMALMEVTAEATQAKSELAATKSELEEVRAEAQHSNNSLLQSSEQKLHDVLKEYNQLKQEYEDSTVAWKEKEDSFMNCIKISEEETNKKDQEISRQTDAHRMAREETSKLRDIIKQAINEATVIKESLEIARLQNYELEEQLSKKENELQQIKHDYESLKVSEAAALDSVRELKSLLASVSAAESNKIKTLSDFESFKLSKATADDRKISKSARKFSSDRWTDMKPLVQQNGHRLSVGESDLCRGLGLEKEKPGSVSNGHDIGLPSFLFSDDRGINTDDFDHLHGILFSDTENEKKKKKRTALRRFGDVLMRRSVHKP
ncbi:putative WEB family protein At1g65010, chloroplastic [Phalaenopsis equestris]|uniref:putative WEB family protein At1g65010, chloroplastic n=1 Tax=Phalaenopsis equestris TaxID=78828 RepID=UPI0009E29867|nr:putative WEB family protein At1g65010, chloroplastic [Phalaenopsis equestris]XP_020575687.1 putative WEB family protein At1g65010, chloroplastic [Phalaenopsis equestris]XP_020575688.1 putative WEB family protein At1g65010, chloroplastic [Phalaenopsis equestris]XP_020575689.1 putative WEB family protein At1g65010, chloroplastic [Phalaenopsis equestris]